MSYSFNPTTNKLPLSVDKWRKAKNLFNGFTILNAETGEEVVACTVYSSGSYFRSIVKISHQQTRWHLGAGISKTYGGAVQDAFNNAGATLCKDLPFHYISDCAEEAFHFAQNVFGIKCYLVKFEA